MCIRDRRERERESVYALYKHFNCYLLLLLHSATVGIKKRNAVQKTTPYLNSDLKSCAVQKTASYLKSDLKGCASTDKGWSSEPNVTNGNKNEGSTRFGQVK